MQSSLKGHGLRGGFTLIELMIVVSIVGILAAIATPKFADLVRRSQEGATLGNLGALRSTLNIYYGGNEGKYPYMMIGLLQNPYLTVVPIARMPPYHAATQNFIQNIWLGLDAAALNASITASINSFEPASSGWGYSSSTHEGGADMAFIYVACNHTDSKGILWSTY